MAVATTAFFNSSVSGFTLAIDPMASRVIAESDPKMNTIILRPTRSMTKIGKRAPTQRSPRLMRVATNVSITLMSLMKMAPYVDAND